MLANLVLEDFKQAVSSGDMFDRLARIGAWFLVLGFHVNYLYSYSSPGTRISAYLGRSARPAHFKSRHRTRRRFEHRWLLALQYCPQTESPPGRRLQYRSE